MAESPEPTDLQATYDRIAEHFAATREYPWPEVEAFLADRSGESALDVGCGNGRHAELLADCAATVVGVDVSRGLLDRAVARARERGFVVSFLQGDAARLPLATGRFDLAVYVAALHHLPTRAARLASLDELARVLAPEGRALVSAWSTAHDRFDREEAFDTTVDWTLPDGETVPRFYHIYSPAAFAADLDASDLRAVETFVSSGNCYAVVAPA
ncbi:MAG: class I SAM-dependent methyltransferase [Haloferacaceae archaeon]